MKKFLISSLAMLAASSFAFGQEDVSEESFDSRSCNIRVSIQSSTSYKSRSDADRFCDQFRFSQIKCSVFDRGYSNWDSVIDFNDVFRGRGNSFQESRTEAYRNYFNWLENRRIYNLPVRLVIDFDCRDGNHGGGGYGLTEE
jgi:hypothetical protein